MIGFFRRRLRLRRARRALAEQVEAFAGEPLMLHLAAMVRVVSPTEREELARYVAEGVTGALSDMGCNGPWGGERKALAEAACHRLLGGALDEAFVQQVMGILEGDTAKEGDGAREATA